MKKTLNFSLFTKKAALIVGIFLIIPHFALASVNLIANPTFSVGGGANNGPLSWNSGVWGDASGTVFTYPVVGQDDNYAAQLTISSYGTAPGGGAAEWYFNPVAVTGNSFYTFSDWYKSDTNSFLVAQFTLSDGTSIINYQLATLPPTNGTWVNTSQSFSVPSDAINVTILHLLQNNGTLTVDNYSLSSSLPPTSNLFSQGMVSLTFDDGYTNQYQNVLPILRSAGLKGTFYIITNPVIKSNAGTTNLFVTSGLSTSTVTSTSTVSWGDITNNNVGAIYTDPTYQDYTFSENYSGTANSTLTVNYCTVATILGVCPTANISSMVVGTIPASVGSSNASLSFSLPTISGNTVTPISFTQTLIGAGSMTVSNPSVSNYEVYINQTQLLAMQSAGQEMGSHTSDHCDLVQLYNDPNSALTSVGCPDYVLSAPSTPQNQINDSRTSLLSMGVTPAVSLAYPLGNYTSNIEQLVSSGGFTNARSVDIGYNTKATDPFDLKVQNLDKNTTVSQVKSWIDTAVANKLWLILVFHEVEDQTLIDKNGDTFAVTPGTLQQVASYLSSNNVNVKTVGDAATLLGVSVPPPPLTPGTPIANPVGGSFTSAQNVSLTSTDSTSIYYTTDGSSPTCSTGNLYSGAISIATSTNLQAIGCNSGGSSSLGSWNYTIGSSTPDSVAPVITLVGNSTVNINVGSAYVDAGATALDNMDGDITSKIVVVNGVSSAIAGTYQVTYNVSDTAGNSATQVTRTVNVNAVVVPPPPSGGGGGGGGVSPSNGGNSSGVINFIGGSHHATTTTTTTATTTATTTGQVLGANTFFFTQRLTLGSTGNEVTELQKRLTAEGLYSGPITGVFGPLTRAAVIAYQIKYGIDPAGIVGPKTRAVLNGSTSPSSGSVSDVDKATLIANILQQITAIQAQLKAMGQT